MNLSDLKQSITELPDEELLALLKDVRSSRRISRKPEGGSRKASAPIGVESLPPNLIDLLINKIEGGK